MLSLLLSPAGRLHCSSLSSDAGKAPGEVQQQVRGRNILKAQSGTEQSMMVLFHMRFFQSKTLITSPVVLTPLANKQPHNQLVTSHFNLETRYDTEPQSSAINNGTKPACRVESIYWRFLICVKPELSFDMRVCDVQRGWSKGFHSPATNVPVRFSAESFIFWFRWQLN